MAPELAPPSELSYHTNGRILNLDGLNVHWPLYTQVRGHSGHEFKLKLSGATAHESQDLLCPFQYTCPLGAVVHEQMSQSGGQSEARPPVFKPDTLPLGLPVTSSS
ncbi:hypothetical protein TNCV_4300631 [Trichonephila clavipes]|nr:hypothetical protein TNCV_4300631 [Trichonephila clavipes]